MRVFAIHANNPIVPRSTTNPVGGADRTNRVVKSVTDRLDYVQAWLIDRFEQIPVDRFLVNALYVNDYRYEYQISVPQLEMLINEMLIELGLIPNDYVVREVVGAYEQGTGLAVDNLTNISDDYTRTVTQVLNSEPWLRRAALVGSRVFEEMKGFEGDTGVDLGRVLRQAVQDGLNPRDVVDTIKQRFGVAESRARRIAQTEISGALRRGRWDEAQDAETRLDIRVRMLWVSALKPTTRLWHASRHGLLYTIQEVREFYASSGNSINCFLPETMVSGRFVAGSKAYYSGDVFDIVTADGRNISVTPNHPIMTNRGLVSAAKITESDYLIADIFHDENFTGVSDLNGQVVNSRIDDVFGALSDIGHANRMRVSAIDFHGDAKFMNKDISVIEIDRVLTYGINSAHFKCLDDLAFVKSDAAIPHFCGSENFSLFSMFHSANRIMGCFGGCLPNFFRRINPANFLRGMHIPYIFANRLNASLDGAPADSVFFTESKNAFTIGMIFSYFRKIKPKLCDFTGVTNWSESDFFKPYVKRSVANANAFSDALAGLAGHAALDKVIKINRRFYAGHVYDLQEVSGLMIANGIISSNCYCTQIECLVDKDGKPVVTRAIDRLLKQKKEYFGD
jgi:hypothetical protein